MKHKMEEMMTREYVSMAELIYKRKIGIISDEEGGRLDEWLAGHVADESLLDRLSCKDEWSRAYEEYGKVRREQAWNRLERRIVPSRQMMVMKRIGYAASILLLFGLGVYFYHSFHGSEQRALSYPLAQMVPGMQHAILHRSNGESVLLDTMNMIISRNYMKNKVEKVRNMLVYQMDSVGIEEKWDVLETPNSCEFQVNLADGTRVWLNAHSRLTYPVAFVGETRVVRLEGEAYFEVQHDEKHPFFVEVNGMSVKVLGTSFNLKSFEMEGRSVATLVRGKIEVSAGGRRVVLLPDQQADLLVEGDRLEIKEVDAESYRAWTKGMFVFRRETLASILNDLARWYNVTVVYEQEECKDILFSGKMNRYESISETLSMIEKTEKVKFDVRGSNVTVKIK